VVAFCASILILIAGCAICFMVASRRPPGQHVTWGEAIVGATFVFGLMLLAYGIVPNQWLKWPDNELLWRPDRILFAVSSSGIHTGAKAATEAAGGRGRILFTYQALRDIIVTLIYVVMLGAHVALWVAFQKRRQRAAVVVAEVERTSTFGRPVVKV